MVKPLLAFLHSMDWSKWAKWGYAIYRFPFWCWSTFIFAILSLGLSFLRFYNFYNALSLKFTEKNKLFSATLCNISVDMGWKFIFWWAICNLVWLQLVSQSKEIKLQRGTIFSPLTSQITQGWMNLFCAKVWIWYILLNQLFLTCE